MISKYKLDPTLNWQVAELVSINDKELKFRTIEKKGKIFEGIIYPRNIKWTLRQNKSLGDVFELGDILFVKKEKNIWKIKQYPKVNGGIVVLDPFKGDVLALVGGFNFKTSEFNRVTQAKRQPGSAFKPIVYATALENGFAPNSIILTLLS